jgi:tRNA(His) 5'-end guanylyltransferase
MVSTAKRVAEEIHATVAYTQSDEITLVLILENKERDEGKLYFGGRPQKLCSILASVASVHFNKELAKSIPEKARLTPVFDCRVWNVPGEKEAANVLLWRELDAFKNGVAALARCHFEAEELFGKGRADMIEMLASKGVTLDDQPDHLFHGTYLRRLAVTRKYTTEELDKLPAKHNARIDPDLMVTRHDITVADFPPLRLVANKPGMLFHGEAPVLRPVAEVVGVT